MAREFIAPFTIAFAALVLAAPAQSLASATAAEASAPDENGCYKRLGIKGRPHKLNTVASLSAVRLWSEAARKHGDSYAMWHNASGSSIKCQKLPRSDYYSCFASGQPCAPSDATPQTVKN